MERDAQALAMDKQRIICPVAISSFPSVLKYMADMGSSFPGVEAPRFGTVYVLYDFCFRFILSYEESSCKDRITL